MNVEHIAGVSLASRRLSRQESDFAVRGGVLGHVIDDDESMPAPIAKVFRHREAGERSDPLQAWGSRCARDNENAAFRRAVGLDCVDDPLDRGRLLTDRDVDADDITGLLVDDAVDSDCCLADSPIPNDQLSLATSQGKHGIEHLYAGPNRLTDKIAVDDCRRWTLDRLVALNLHCAAVVERAA